MTFLLPRSGLAACLALLCACAAGEPSLRADAAKTNGPTIVDGVALRSIDMPANMGDWLSHGRGWAEQRFSPLDEINAGNVAGVGLAWFDDLETMRGAIVLGGILADKGMASFADVLSEEDAHAIHAYLIARANEDWQMLPQREDNTCISFGPAWAR